jgi:hypothetical protein
MLFMTIDHSDMDLLTLPITESHSSDRVNRANHPSKDE